MNVNKSCAAVVCAAVAAVGIAPALAAPTSWNAFNDFWVDVPATGGAGDFTRADWVAGAGQYPGDTGLTIPNAWGYAGANFNGFGFPTSVGTYVSAASGGGLYPLTSGNTYAGPGASYLTGGVSFWIGYNDQYGIVGLPNALTQIGKYTSEWFSGSPNYAGNPGGTNDKYLWMQATGLTPSTNGLGALLTWTAPTAGDFKFSGSYVNGNYGQSTDFAIVDSLSATLLSKVTLSPASSVSAFEFTKTYAAGDIVQFQVGTPAAAQGSPLGLAVDVVALAPPVITITVASGTQTQSQAGYPLLSGSTPVQKTGAGTLVMNVANTVTGSTTIQQGTMQLADAAALAASRITPLAGGTLTLAPYLQTTIAGLHANAGGLTDVGNGMVTVAAGLSAPSLVAAIVTGMGDGSWNGTSGITSSVAAASGGDRTVGWLDNGDGSVTFAFAAAGDTNLDWQVDIIDAANFLAGGKFDTGSPASWNEGDFTYDGLVDILDAASFLSNGLFDAGAYNTAPPAVAAVPEPTQWAWALVVVAAAIRRLPRSRSGGAVPISPTPSSH